MRFIIVVMLIAISIAGHAATYTPENMAKAYDIAQKESDLKRTCQLAGQLADAYLEIGDARTYTIWKAIEDGVVREALLKNANLYIRSSSDDALGRSWERWFSLFPDAKSFFLAPIVHDNALLGVIYADYSRSNEQGWTSEELEAVEAIKRVVRLALQAERTMHSPSSE